MTRAELKKCPNFSYKEIVGTGAKLKDVKAPTMYKLQKLRRKLKRRIRLLKNGITSGKHNSKRHPNGEAIDFALYANYGVVDSIVCYQVVKLALAAGFNGIGVYWNGKAYSFHVDTRPLFTPWGACRKKGKWVYFNLLKDPKGIKV